MVKVSPHPPPRPPQLQVKDIERKKGNKDGEYKAIKKEKEEEWGETPRIDRRDKAKERKSERKETQKRERKREN